jgi:HK97 gp10 family phage protein
VSARVLLEGVDELRDALQRLPADLNREARGEVVAAAEGAAADLRAAYPEKTGNLRRGVKVTTTESTASTVAIVKSTAKHAHLWEFGTENRRTQKLFNRGAMPAQYDRGLVGIAIRRRRRLEQALVAIVERHGFQVTP